MTVVLKVVRMVALKALTMAVVMVVEWAGHSAALMVARTVARKVANSVVCWEYLMVGLMAEQMA